MVGQFRDVAASGSRLLRDDVTLLSPLLLASACDCICDTIDALPTPHTWVRHALCARRKLACNDCIPEALQTYASSDSKPLLHN